MRVVVLGAGASFGRGDGGAVPPPLVDGFFDAAVRLGLFDESRFPDWRADLERRSGRSWEELVKAVPFFGIADSGDHLVVLKSFVEEQLGIRLDEYRERPVNVERLMGLIEGELLGYHGVLRLHSKTPEVSHSSPADVLQEQLYLIICGTLVATANGNCPFHIKVANALQPGDTVVSFNYDLLIDKALQSRGDWYMNDGYRLTFQRIGHHAGDQGEWREPLVTYSGIKLLKLHGSLNWLHPRNATQAALNLDLHGIHTAEAPRVLYCLDDLHADFWSDHPLFEWWERYDHSEGNQIIDLHALIVPPSLTKPYRNLEPLVGRLWATAAVDLITKAKEIVFIGYSLRPEDLRSYWLFRKASAESDKLQRVLVVDPSEQVFQRIRDVFHGTVVEKAGQTLAEFAASL